MAKYTVANDNLDDWSKEHEARGMAIMALLSSSEKPNRRKKE